MQEEYAELHTAPVAPRKALKNAINRTLSTTRWEAYSNATNAAYNTFDIISEALEISADDESQNTDTRYDIVSLESLVSFREKFNDIEEKTKQLLPAVGYTEIVKRTRRRKNQPNDGNAPEVQNKIKILLKMEFGLSETCKLENIPVTRPEDAWVYTPCQKNFVMVPEDEISLDSILSMLLSTIEPTEAQFGECHWSVTATDMHNAKQALLFEEKLFISEVKTRPCKLGEENKIFLETELNEIGYTKLNIEESYDGYVVFNRSQISKGKAKNMCGHCLRGKYKDNFLLIAEKRNEFDYIDKARIEKNMEVRNKGDSVMVIRETKINTDSQKFKAKINIKDRVPVFIMDGGVQLLMRHLIINNFVGSFEYYTMNIFGKILRSVISVEKERKRVRIFYRTFTNLIVVKNTKYLNYTADETSETYLTNNGKIVLHFWRNSNYLLHAIRSPLEPRKPKLPKLELIWKADNLLFKCCQEKKKLTMENATWYLQNHPEVVDFVYDFILSTLRYKPDVVFPFTIKFFQNLKNSY
ncbi:uncharacterized protein [Eurosta solidaginis]|uniref:uncharacterized protein n=1 Tax=Eurosta solidaginis TaxID=178769 RepID=UPI0035313942